MASEGILMPPALELSCGDWPAYLDRLYEIYLDTVVRPQLTYRGLRVSARRNPETNGKGAGFWHIVSEGKEEDERLPDPRRCERIRWIEWVIRLADAGDPLVDTWTNRRKGNVNEVLWCEPHEYAVILSRRNGFFLLSTAYCVTKSHRIATFRSERDAARNRTQ
jgi:hypothetical protein